MTSAGTPTSSPEATGIRDALLRHLEHPDQDLMSLRDAVCAFVAALRDRGVPPERTLIAVKAVMSSVHVDPRDLDRLRELKGIVTKWCVDEYYA